MTRIIGLTGGIGSGKSTVANYIASKGIPVYIADEEAKKIMERTDVKHNIQNLFPQSVLNDDNTLNRNKIAEFVFSNPEKLKQLNAIVHPEVKNHFGNWINEHKNVPFIIKEVAILFETGGHKDCDKVILITAPEEVRIERAMKRDNSSKKSVSARIKNQLPEADKIKLSDFVVENTNLETTLLKIDEILKILAKT
ncbi:MAG: dephospho-CoA kinase [Flavobacterium sp.]|jgi:dephospho-CoA kinase|uniref:dephospho-CoA kinase n=1 Tax=Flavobacterium sp. TaxID=239 RepID=UPI002973055D|nr:dephospho-CoA kinase [Flavobacterium sp.]TAF08145.1 MAG: dephospho-CoA kinase [Flavobacteriia bacterium]WRH74030.1 MAG: dephospho-CoA kinase [Flavobacterium sp.]